MDLSWSELNGVLAMKGLRCMNRQEVRNPRGAGVRGRGYARANDVTKMAG